MFLCDRCKYNKKNINDSTLQIEDLNNGKNLRKKVNNIIKIHKLLHIF
jgi:hypothetical protein